MKRMHTNSHRACPGAGNPGDPPLGGVAQILLWLLAGLVAAGAIYAQRPPAALGADAPANQFSAMRAMAPLRHIAQRPHPIGSGDNRRVRDYLINALDALGAKVHVETGVGVFQVRSRYIAAGTVHDIVAKIPGTDNQRAVMLTAHYDSVPFGPGAADDGAGVATILETLRALKAGPPLKNNILVVFTDGEESGLLGAAAYAADHPELAQRVGVVLNFEARGSSGPVAMFETSDQNGWLIRQFAKAAPYPIASSLTYTLYKRLPNDTDLTVFKRAGLAGLNFAFIGTFQDYHTPLDTVANLDPDTLQHMGSYALALTRHFGNLSLTDVRQPDRVYFDWLGSQLIQYPLWVAWAALLFAGLLFVTVIAVGARKRRMKFSRVAIGFGGFFLLMLGVPAAIYAVWWIVRLLIGPRLLFADTLSNQLIVAGLVLVGIAAGALLQRWLSRKAASVETAVGILFGFGLVTVLVSVLLPGGSFLLEWPLIAGLLGLLLTLWKRRPAIVAAWLGLSAIPAILLFAPLIDSMLTTLNLNTASVIVIAILLGLLLAAAAPLLIRLSRSWRICVPALAIGATACFIYGASLSHFSAQHPERDTLYYSVNTDQGKAAWVSYDAAPDAWTAQYLGHHPRRGRAPALTLGSLSPVLRAKAPVLALEPPAATVISDVTKHGDRTLTLHITSPRHANVLLLRLDPATKVVSVAWNGRAVSIRPDAGSGAPWTLTYSGLPPEGANLTLRLANKAPVKCWIGDRSRGLPKRPGRHRRSDHRILVYGGNTTVTKRCAF